MYYIFFFLNLGLYTYIHTRVTFQALIPVACKVLQRGLGVYRMGDMRDHYGILTCDPQIFNQVL